MSNALVGKKFDALDDGFIRVVDIMGDDTAITQAARVCYGDGTKTTSDDRALLRYMYRHGHHSPFEMCEIKLHVRVPMDTWRQWIRHRTANVNEYSTRYSIAIDRATKTHRLNWRRQSTTNKQGSADCFDSYMGDLLSAEERKIQEHCRQVYERRIRWGVAREQARKDLPLCTYTEAYWKIDLRNLLHFLGLRMEADAQKEIREYATIIGNEIVAHWCPLTWEAFCDYHLNAFSLSAPEQRLIQAAVTGQPEKLKLAAANNGWTKKSGKREVAELAAKLKKLGMRSDLESFLFDKKPEKK